MRVRSGTAVVVGLIAVLAIGWFAYRTLIPPHWLRLFAAEIALRTTPDPNAPPPEDTRQASPHIAPDHPYICFARVVPFAWDKLFVVPSGADPRDIAALQTTTWPSGEPAHFAALMQKDPRYQLIVLVKDNRVIADALFYTFWGDLSALARPDGFTPDTAVFTAAVKGDTQVLRPVDPVPSVCRSSP